MNELITPKEFGGSPFTQRLLSGAYQTLDGRFSMAAI